jgi:PEP-CTERM motif
MGVFMKRLGFVLLALVAALACTSGAMADPVTGSNAIAGMNHVFSNSTNIAFTNSGLAIALGSNGTRSGISGPVTLSGFRFSHPDDVEVFDVNGGVGSPASFAVDGDTAEAIVNGILTITGSGLLAEAGYDTNKATFDLGVSSSGQLAAVELGSVSAPEPSSLLVLGTGLLGLAFVFLRKAKSPGVAVND